MNIGAYITSADGGLSSGMMKRSADEGTCCLYEIKLKRGYFTILSIHCIY